MNLSLYVPMIGAEKYIQPSSRNTCVDLEVFKTQMRLLERG